jgi:ubiquinone/menaquinone biosynthesis C-methylase UbiE
MVTQDQIRTSWDVIAAGYDQFSTPINMLLGQDALRRVNLQPGMRMLDVAAGCGALSIPAARIGAEVTAVDIAPAMIELLRARAREEKLSNLHAHVMDGEALELDDDSFDVSGSQFGVMLFPDLPRGLAEMARVTRPGGQVLIVAFGNPATVEFIGYFMGAIQSAVPGFTGLPMDPPPLPFQVADPEKLRQEMVRAGLRDVRVEQTNHAMAYESGEHMWNQVTTSNPIGAMLVADLTDEQGASAQRALDGMLRQRSGGNGPATLNAAVNIGIGTA